MIDLSQWRASIGGWNIRYTSYSCPSPNQISAVGDCLGALAVFCGCQVTMSLSVVLGLRLVLMLSGDIELNPGPGQRLESGDVFCLLELLELHSGSWDDIGRALKVSSDFREGLLREGVMSTNKSKLERILNKWIELECSEVSWNHLIKVLQNDLKLATTSKQIIDYLLNNDEAKEKYQWKDESVSTDDHQSGFSIPSLPPCLTRYSDLLKQKYSLQPVISRADWPPKVGKDYYGRLLLLNREKQNVEIEQNKIWNTMRGKIDILPKVTKSHIMGIQDVLKPDSSNSIVLIDGPPGVGKTTLCRKILNMWANGQLPSDQQQRYTVVLYCLLRDKRITGANTLTDIMKTCYCDGNDDDSIEVVSKYIAEHSGDGLLILFDGWDELSMEHRESSLAARFIRREILLKSKVIVTSRSYASESIMSLSENYRHFEVIGFGEGEVYKVIEETLHDDQELACNLMKELKSQRNIESLCYIPLICSMVILVFKKSKHLPSRLTELYEQFVLYAVKRHMKKHSTTDPKRIQSLKKLPPCITLPFEKLCHFAYLSLKKNNPRMTFYLHELQEDATLDESVAELGLMTTVSVFDQELYQFPHLTIQEFLAAWWIAINNDGMDIKAFEEHFEDDHFRMCLRFVAGLTGLRKEKFKETKYFAMQLDLRCTSRNDLNKCAELVSTDISRKLLHLLYESNNIDLCKHLANAFTASSFCVERFCRTFKLNSFDGICMLFFLHASGITWKKIHLSISLWCPLPGLIMADDSTDIIECNELIIECKENPILEIDGFLDKILCLFSSQNVNCKCKSQFCLYQTLLLLLEKPQMKKISTNYDHQMSDHEKSFEPKLKELLRTTTTLEELTLEELKSEGDVFGSSVSGHTVLAVFDGVRKNKSIKSLKIMMPSTFSNTRLSLLLREFKRLLKDNTMLEEVEFEYYRSDISEINAPLRSVPCSWLKSIAIESVLAKCQYLHSLIIDVDFLKPGKNFITNVFYHLPKLNKLCVLFPVKNCEFWVELFTVLQTNQTLEELMIRDASDIAVMSDVLLLFKKCLILNKTMKHLQILNGGLGLTPSEKCNYQIALTEGLSCNQTIEQLSLPIDISTSEGRSLLNTVFKMESLISLQLRPEGDFTLNDVNLFPMVISALSKNLHNIKELYIKLVPIQVIGTARLFDAEFKNLIKEFCNHPTLEYVGLDVTLQCSAEVPSHLKNIANKELVSSCSNSRKKVPPLIYLSIHYTR